MNDLGCSRKRVLVVGGSSGIGNGIAHGFHVRGGFCARHSGPMMVKG